MRVLQINAVNGIRSTGRITTELADYLNEKGHEGYVAYSSGTPYQKGFEIGNISDRKIHGLLSRVTGKQAYFSKNSTKDLTEWMENNKPDIVHLGNLHGNYINLEMLLQYLSINDIPTVVTLHDCWFYTGKCTHYTFDNCYKWKEKCGGCPRLRKDNKSWFFDQTTSMLLDKKEWFSNIPRLAVIGVSDWITNEAKQSILSNAKTIKRIYNWIDLSKFKPTMNEDIRKKYGLKNKFIVLGVASKWTSAKGLYKFLNLADEIHEDMVIVIVGNLPEGIKLLSNVIHLPETHSIDELVEIYSMADVFINMSLEESFGKVTAEALACGTPVITNKFTANPELVDRKCGIVVNDFDDIIQAIEHIKNKGKDFYSDSCIAFSNRNFNKEDRIRDHLDIYKTLLESGVN